jgi:rhamnose transport system substrate-binding protein
MRPLLALSLVGLLVLAGCTAPTSTSSNPPTTTPSTAGNSPGGTSAGGTLKIGLMPKQKGIPYFNACEQGAKEAAQELGDVELTYDGPIEDKSESQSQLLDSWVLRKFDAVAVACNDPEQISTSLSRARDENITAVTWDADADPAASKRQFFVNQADVHAIAQTLMDEMAKQAGEDAKVAVVSSSSTAPNQSAWLKEMEVIRGQKYPKMQIVTTEYAGENQVKSFEKAQNILKAYPDVKGIWGMTSVAFPGTAQAVEKAGKTGQVAVVGLGTPNDMKPFVKSGVVKSVVLWSPVDLGYLTIHVARAVARGELKAGDTSVKAGRLGEKEVKGDVVLLGDPMVFTRENIDKFDF